MRKGSSGGNPSITVVYGPVNQADSAGKERGILKPPFAVLAGLGVGDPVAVFKPFIQPRPHVRRRHRVNHAAYESVVLRVLA